MLQGTWKETANFNEPIQLPLADHRIFPHFLNWLYLRRFNWAPNSNQDICKHCRCQGCPKNASSSAKDCSDGLEPDPNDDEWLEAAIDSVNDNNCLTQLYIFADKFEVPALREEIINLRWADCMLQDSCWAYIVVINSFRHLPESPPQCRLLLDSFVDIWDPKDDMNANCCTEVKLRSKLPLKFMFLLAAGQARKLAGGCAYALGPLCKYHEHSQDKETVAACKKRMAKMMEDHRRGLPDWDALEKRRIGWDTERKA